MTEPGRLEVRVEDDSVWLSNNLPYVVRDARHAVVARGSSGTGVDELPAGLYSVEVLSPRGVQHTELVQLAAGATTPLVMTEDGLRSAAPPRPPAAAEGPEPPLLPPDPVEVRAPSGAELRDVSGCSLLEEDDQGWIFVPDGDLAAVPVAAFDLDGVRWEVSLPLNPEGAEPVLRQCRVRVETTAVVPRLEVGFGDRRRVCRMLVGMLRAHGVAGGAEMLDTAAGLLLSKYSDPAAAALGGLTLHRFGRLQERQSWVENLSRDFGWLPDGRILCAALLQRDEDPTERARGLALLLDATAVRPLYTDGLSLGSELLRRWPGEDAMTLRTQRLTGLAVFSAGADWESVALTTRAEA